MKLQWWEGVTDVRLQVERERLQKSKETQGSKKSKEALRVGTNDPTSFKRY